LAFVLTMFIFSVCESVWSYFYLMLICASLFYFLLYSYVASRNRKGESESYYPVQRPWLCICLKPRVWFPPA